jgi:hypothetical protein
MSRRLARTLGGSLLALVLLLGAGAAGAEPRGLERAPESFKTWLESLPEGQRRSALRRLGDMPTHRRNRLFHRWEALEEGERRAFQQRMLDRLEGRESQRERLERMSPESRERLAPLVRRWRDMGPDDRRRMRQRLERFRTLSPGDQQALIDRRFEDRSPEERAKILDSLRAASEALPERPLLEAPPEPAPD